MDDFPLPIQRFDFNLGKLYLRQMMELATLDFLDRGGKITVCRPAYAFGCETPSNVRSMVRRDWK